MRGKKINPDDDEELRSFIEDEEFDYDWREVDLPTSLEIKQGDYLDPERVKSLEDLGKENWERAIVCWKDGGLKLFDGGHRLHIARRNKLPLIKAFVGFPP